MQGIKGKVCKFNQLTNEWTDDNIYRVVDQYMNINIKKRKKAERKLKRSRKWWNAREKQGFVNTRPRFFCFWFRVRNLISETLTLLPWK